MMPNNNLDQLKQAILQVVTYADIFDYPLTIEEIHRYCEIKTSLNIIYAELHGFGSLKQIENYFTLPGREELVATRQRREKISTRLWPQAIYYGRLIASLPFVRMVAVTGSLAVNNTEDPADIDYLVVTDPGHLWTCRALILVLAKMAVLRGLNLCPNYLITTRALEFQEHNLYVAHELTQMVPLSGMDVYVEIRRQNPWVAGFLPNADGLPPGSIANDSTAAKPWLRSLLEGILGTPLGTWLERWEMDRKIRRLNSEQGSSNESNFSADVCKGHDQRHQYRTKQALDAKTTALLSKY